MASIEFQDVSKSFDDNTVIEHLNLKIEDGKFTVLVGPSGCGKTTLLRMVAGIGPASSGKVLMDGEDITHMPPGRRDIAMVFQNYAIYPTMNVRENIEFGLKNKKIPAAERKRRIEEVSRIVGLDEFLDRKPSTLSGGQRQRIALARAMTKEPKVFLMDEPLSNLDAKLRVAMRTELIELHARLNTTFIYVTHDQTEAMAMADQIVLINHGKIMQTGEPEKVYNDPDNIFTAQFIGTPAMNVLQMKDGRSVGVRPEHLLIFHENPGNENVIGGEIVTREMLGSETTYKVQTGKASLIVKSVEGSFHPQDNCFLLPIAQKILLFAADGRRIRESFDGEKLVKEAMNEQNK